MDSREFDALTRKLATDGSRRSLIGGLLGGATLFGLGRSGALARQGKTTICHQTGNGYNVITVANPSLPDHYGHGDFAYTNCCADGDCAGDNICQTGTCVRPCPPYNALIDGVCQHPCPESACQCEGNTPTACVANFDGVALCAQSAGHGVGFNCQTDQDCQDAFGGFNETTGPNDFTYVCNQGHPEGKVCYGNPTYCPIWIPVPL